jgi:hypothetical protein
MKKFLLVLTVLQFLAAAVPATARENKKKFCGAFDCSDVVLVKARHDKKKQAKKQRNEEFCKSFYCEDVVFAKGKR